MTPLDFLRTIGTNRSKTPEGVYVCTSIRQDATASAVWHSKHGLLTLQAGHGALTAADVVASHGRSGAFWTLCLYDHEDGNWSTSADPTPKPLAAIAATLPLPFKVPA